MKTIFILIFLAFSLHGSAQDIKQIVSIIAAMERDTQFTHATISLYVTDARSGKVVFDKNGEVGMAPASSQKVITSVTAFELLGKDFNYETKVYADAAISNGTLAGNLYFPGSGDPTLGSWRYTQTKEARVFNYLIGLLKKRSISEITGGIIIDDRLIGYPSIPDSWMWQDIGNYYGAGAWAFNWHENQYDLHLRSSDMVGSRTEILSTTPVMLKDRIHNYITAGKKGSGDNGYLYTAPYDVNIFATGTIPAGEKDFVISGSIPNPPEAFSKKFIEAIRAKNIRISDSAHLTSSLVRNGIAVIKSLLELGTITSPSFDSMNYYFLKRSINLYGEAFVKAIAIQKGKAGNTDEGVEIIRSFWMDKGIERSALKMMDGSGLSPANRITTKALVHVMKYARDKPWYGSFYHALPEINGIKMKSGTIGGAKSFTGYITSRSGNEYIFAFIINNFHGSAGTVVEKMYKVLNLLK